MKPGINESIRSGRTYTLKLMCRDAAGNVTVKTTTVFVPHHQ
jgi:hypothetical protein